MSYSHINAALFMIIARVLSMGTGLAGIPLLLVSLGTEGFAAWAVLLGGSAAFYALEMGMTPTVVKFIVESNSIQNRDTAKISMVLSNAIILLCLIYMTGFTVIVFAAAPTAAWLKLPETDLLTSGGLLVFVFSSVTLSSIIKTGVNTLHAARRFDLVAVISLAHALSANVVSWIVAYVTHRLDLVIISFWSCQLIVLTGGLFFAKRFVPWRFKFNTVRWSILRNMFFHGFYLQFSDLSHFVHFQFDKMIIAGMVGLSEVAHYEIGNRSAMALRSLCSSGIGTFLPTATAQYGSGNDVWPSYLEASRASAYAAVIFLLVPIVISPLFLFAWVGQIGYHGRWVFIFLAGGIMFNVLSLPVSIFIQAMGRTSLEAKMAAGSIVLNVVLSLWLIRYWGKEGAAAGTGLAMALSSIVYVYVFHRICGRRMAQTCAYLWRQLWPALAICTGCFAVEKAIEPLVLSSRWYMGPAAVLLYISCVAAMAAAYYYSGRLGENEIKMFSRLVRGMGLKNFGKADEAMKG